MSNHDEKDLLTRELRERSADVGGHPIGFDAVRQSARRMQRRRNIVSGAVAAVVASIALPTGVAITSAINGPDDLAKEPTVANSPSADASPLPAPEPRPDGSYPLTLHGIPRGADPKVSYVLNDEKLLVTPDAEHGLPDAYSQIVPYRDGWLALYGGANGYENLVLDSEMNVVDRTLGGDALTLNADGSRVLTVQRDFNVPGRTVVVDQPAESASEREAVTYDAPSDREIAPVGYLDDKRAVYQAIDGESPVVEMVVNDDDPHSVPLTGFDRVTSVSEANGLVAGTLADSYDPSNGSCWGVMDPTVQKMVWDTCEYSLFEFSPDGRYVIAGPTYIDMWGPSQLTVLDTSTWKPVVEFTPDKDTVGQVAQATWEDEDTVAAVVVEGSDFGIVRAELNGRLELTTGLFQESNMTLPLWLAEQPRR